MIPAEALTKAVRAGYKEVYELAEYFDVTEDFVREAYRIHKLKGNIN